MKRILSSLHALLLHAHQAYLRRQRVGDAPDLPLIIIGAFRWGGSGKTPVTEALARWATEQGLRVAVLAYHLNYRQFHKQQRRQSHSPPDAAIHAVTLASPWQSYSDEALLLVQRLPEVEVFVTKNRWLAWQALAQQQKFDLVISDDGLLDPRFEKLPQVKRLVLVQPDESTHVSHLWPRGNLRFYQSRLMPQDRIWLGPQRSLLGGEPDFQRRLVFPSGFDFAAQWGVLCALGQPDNFLKDLQGAGVEVTYTLRKQDHAQFYETELRQLFALYPRLHWLCTAKDAVKLPEFCRRKVKVVDEKFTVSPQALKSLGLKGLKPFPSELGLEARWA